MSLAVFILAFVTVQRVGELLLAQHNTARLRAQGAYEVGADHYPLIVLLHGAWLIGLWYFVVWTQLPPATNLGWLGVFVILQALRIWVIVTLGARWTTRIIVLRGAPLVSTGPYRFLSHPNYCVVVAEILVLPLVFGLLWFGVFFSVLNGLALWRRIRSENAALNGYRGVSRP